MEVTPLTDSLGGEVHGVDLSRPVPGPVVARINEALAIHGVLLFRGQEISPKQHTAFSRHFGELIIHVLEQYQVPGCPEVFVISNVKENGKNIGAAGGGHIWHSDMSYDPTPPMGSLFYCHECPRGEGQTEFAGMFAAFDALPAERQAWLLEQSAVHDYVFHYEKYLTHRAPLTDEQKSKLQPTPHPAVRTHPVSGKQALYISEGLTSHFEKMDVDESREIIREICEFATQPRFVYRHEWEPGDLVFWDNRSTLHRAMPFDQEASRRLMHRTTVTGDQPFLRT
jgi:taurine dioxygenase